MTVPLTKMECCEETLRELSRKICSADGLTSIIIESADVSLPLTQTNNNLESETDHWVSSEEKIPWTESKIASYSLSQKLFRCDDCECVGFLSRVAEHWLGTHANLRVFQCSQCSYTSAWARCVRMHLAQQHNLVAESNLNDLERLWKVNPVLEEVTNFLQRLKLKVENEHVPIKEVKIELDESAISITQQNPSNAPVISNIASKRYNCVYCPYATDRKDLYTRHENIHLDDKPFHCYICLKQFSRADHVKKHFVRIHREVVYDINRIKREERKDMSLRKQISSKQSVGKMMTKVAFQQAEPTEKQKQKINEKKYKCCYCSWTTTDNWCLKRHLNTHLKPYSCSLCEYKAARSDRLTTHIFKVHNTKLCDNCSFDSNGEPQFTFQLQEEK